jgi:hypothetical protein
MPRAVVVSLFLVLLAWSRDTSAFCGFYVGGADAKLFNNATQVVLMRDGTRTVLAMQNNYEGPPSGFAMVVPVPVILEKSNVKTLQRAVFDKIDQLTAPRLVEYWEQDPCAPDSFGAGLGLRGTGAGGGGAGIGVEKKGDLGVTVEAKFEVGEYEVVILSAKDSTGLDTWLRQESYAIPNGAASYLNPYVQAGSKFFVAKVDPKKVKFENGGPSARKTAQLSPLRFHYDTPELSLPVRLGLINSNGTQDLVVHVLGKHQRFEPANYRSVTIPTNLDLAEQGKGEFGRFYAALFDRTLEKNPQAIVTEYSWDASTCDPCPGPALDRSDLATLGADALSAAGPRVSNARVESKEDPAFAAQVTSRVRGCHSRRMEDKAGLKGSLDVGVTWSDGASAATIKKDDVKDADLASCITGVLNGNRVGGGLAGLGVSKNNGPPSTIHITLDTMPEIEPGAWTITRLHARYSKDALGPDIVFRAAPPIAGGREVRQNGVLEHGSTKSPSNNFQARYVIRHPWTGAVECKEPKRGRWGGPLRGSDAGVLEGVGPFGGSSAPRPEAATKIAFAPRGGIELAALVRSDAPEIDLKAANPAPSASPSAAPASGGDASAASGDGGSAAGGPGKGGCGSCGIGVLVALYAGRRRKKV